MLKRAAKTDSENSIVSGWQKWGMGYCPTGMLATREFFGGRFMRVSVIEGTTRPRPELGGCTAVSGKPFPFPSTWPIWRLHAHLERRTPARFRG